VSSSASRPKRLAGGVRSAQTLGRKGTSVDSREVQVGVGVIVVRAGLVLLGERTGSHGASTWALPGGHLEFGESPTDCAHREVLEETGLEVRNLHLGPFTSNVFAGEGKHYVTLFVLGHGPHGNPEVREPSKCLRWQWFAWSELPQPLFPPVASLVHSGFRPAHAA